jgi:uncharacterized protein (TIGR03435 family)
MQFESDYSTTGMKMTGPQFRVDTKNHLRTLTFQAAPMPYIARWLSSEVKRLVVDQTGFDGTFGLEFRFSPEVTQPALAVNNAPPPLTEPEGPSIFTAIQKQAGLKLQLRRLAVPIWMIDHVTPPTENSGQSNCSGFRWCPVDPGLACRTAPTEKRSYLR